MSKNVIAPCLVNFYTPPPVGVGSAELLKGDSVGMSSPGRQLREGALIQEIIAMMQLVPLVRMVSLFRPLRLQRWSFLN